MRVALLVRDSAAARQLARRIAERWELPLVISESGRSARARKLKRELRRGFPWRTPLTLIDLFALWLFEAMWKAYLRRTVGTDFASEWPNGSKVVQVDDANDPESVEALREVAADIVLVLGTAILRGETLRVPRRYLLNIHGGIVPRYRNVHSEFWALARHDPGNIGVSILHLDEGIDSGAIALQRHLHVEPGESLFSIRLRNSRLAIEAALEAVSMVEAGQLAALPQRSGEAGFYRTPRASDLLRFFLADRGRVTGGGP